VLIRGERGMNGVFSRHGNGIVTIETGFVPRTDRGIDLLVTGPLNAPRDGIAPLSAIIEADWVPIGLTLNFAFTHACSVRFRRGDPLAQIIPLVRGLTEQFVIEIRDARNDETLGRQLASLRIGERFVESSPRAPSAVRAWWQTPSDASMVRRPDRVAMRGDDAIQALAAMEIHCEEDFIDAKTCDALVSCFARQQGDLVAQKGNAFFDNRVLWHARLPPEEYECVTLMQQARRAIKERVARLFNVPVPLWSDSIQLVKWEGGQPMRPHADSAFTDGSPHPTPHRDYAAIVYLNDDYEGGDIYFPNQNVQVAPRRGLLLIFRGGVSHIHGVREVTKGIRYTMPSWYTLDPRQRELTDI
jgi:hypothetical protein